MNRQPDKRKKRSTGDDTRGRLLEAAIHLVQERGLGGATARGIAAAADANLGSIVYYYGSKDALVEQALVAACERWAQSLKTNGFASAEGRTLTERIATSLGAFSASLTGNRPLALVFLEALASADRSPAVRSALADYYDDLRKAVSLGTGKGTEALGFGGGAADGGAAGAIVALFDGLLIQRLLEPDLEFDPLELVASVGRLFALE